MLAQSWHRAALPQSVDNKWVLSRQLYRTSLHVQLLTEFSNARDTVCPGLMPASFRRPAVSQMACCRAPRDTGGVDALHRMSAGALLVPPPLACNACRSVMKEGVGAILDLLRYYSNIGNKKEMGN